MIIDLLLASLGKMGSFCFFVFRPGPRLTTTPSSNFAFLPIVLFLKSQTTATIKSCIIITQQHVKELRCCRLCSVWHFYRMGMYGSHDTNVKKHQTVWLVLKVSAEGRLILQANFSKKINAWNYKSILWNCFSHIHL